MRHPNTSITRRAVAGALGLLSVVAMWRIATLSDAPVIFRLGVLGLLGCSLFSCVRAWVSAPLSDRQLFVIYESALGASSVLMIVGYITR